MAVASRSLQLPIAPSNNVTKLCIDRDLEVGIPDTDIFIYTLMSSGGGHRGGLTNLGQASAVSTFVCGTEHLNTKHDLFLIQPEHKDS